MSKLSSFFKGVLTKEVLDKFKKSFLAEEKNILAQNVCTKQDPFELALSRKVVEDTQHVFNTKVKLSFVSITLHKVLCSYYSIEFNPCKMFVLPLPVWLMLIFKQAINHINKLQALYEKFTLDNHNYLDKNRMLFYRLMQRQNH